MVRTLVGMVLAVVVLSAAACGNGTSNDPLSEQKKQLLQGQHNGIDQCTQLGLPAGCDLCAELGFYGDGICDNALILHGLCVGPDPDCVAAELVCDNGSDDDLDGLVDCADPDCDLTPACWPGATCGDGLVQGAEECDDGNSVNGDGCSVTCLLETAGESHCWDRMDNDGDGLVDCADPDCSTDPVCLATCGDGVVEGLEECDDGNTQSGDGCSASCTWETSFEVCGDGVDNDLDGLVDCADSDCYGDPACGAATCGNGVVEPGEECDDGNSVNGDGCSKFCLLEEDAFSCTDGVDNDRDGLIDCADPDCATDPGCP